MKHLNGYDTAVKLFAMSEASRILGDWGVDVLEVMVHARRAYVLASSMSLPDYIAQHGIPYSTEWIESDNGGHYWTWIHVCGVEVGCTMSDEELENLRQNCGEEELNDAV